MPAQPDGLLDESVEDLYENAPCGYLSTLPDGTIAKVNSTFLRWLGRDRDEVVGRVRFQDLLTPGGRIYHETHLAPLLRMQGRVREIALEIAAADGTRLPVLITSELRTDERGDPIVTRTTVFDARDRHAYERELLDARRREAAARERVERLQRITARLAIAIDASQIEAAVVEEIEGMAVAQAAALVLGTAAHDDADAEVFPLAVEERSAGVLAVRVTVGAALDGEERALLEAVARQAAQALERVRLHEQEHEVAQTLQRGLLVGTPPADGRYAVAARYLSAVRTLEVGGDWYDVFAIDEHRLGIVVGDVVGRGVRAASATGHLRSAVRVLGGAGFGPARLLEELDRFVEQLEPARMATVAYAELDLSTGSARYACAGHPPPLLAQPGDEPGLLWGGRGAPLGAYDAPTARKEAELTLMPGALLVLYTDGLVERRDRPLDAGLYLLAEETARRRAEALPALVDGLTDALLAEGRCDDDVCVLGLTFSAA